MLETSWPFTETSWSPGLMPPLAPGPPGSTRSAVIRPPCSTHQTPSSGTRNFHSVLKLKPAKTTAATVRRNNRTAIERTWLSRFMGCGAAPEPGGRIGPGLRPRRSSMSNFAAMLFPVPGLLSTLSKASSKIIDGFMEIKYAFLEVCVESCILLGWSILGGSAGIGACPVGSSTGVVEQGWVGLLRVSRIYFAGSAGCKLPLAQSIELPGGKGSGWQIDKKFCLGPQ